MATKPKAPAKPETYASVGDLVYKVLAGNETGNNRALAFATFVADAGGDINAKTLPESIATEARASCTRRFTELHKTLSYAVTRATVGDKVKYTATKLHPGMTAPENAVESFDLDPVEWLDADVKSLDPEKRAAVVLLRKEWSDYCRLTVGSLKKAAVKAVEKRKRIEDAIAGLAPIKAGRGGGKTYRARVEAALEAILTLTYKKSGKDASCPPQGKVLVATANAQWLKAVFGE